MTAALLLVIKATLILLAALGLDLALRRRHVLACAAMWNASLVALLALPALAMSLPAMRLPVLVFSGERLANADTASPSPTRPLGKAEIPSADAKGEASPPAFPDAKSLPVGGETQRQPAGSLWNRGLIGPTVGAVYVLGVCVLLVRLAISWFAAARLRSAALPLASGVWTERFAAWRSKLGLRCRVQLTQSDQVAVPIVVGYFRPVVVLPRDLAEQPETTRDDAIVAHELAHVLRGDYAWEVVLRLLQALLWFHPLIWLAARRINFVRERACDDFAIHLLGSHDDYADALLSVAARLTTRPALSLSLAVLRTPRIAARIEAIMASEGNPLCRLPALVGATILAIVLLMAGLLGSVTPGQGQEPERKPTAKNDDVAKPKAKEAREQFIRVATIAGRASDPDGSPIRGATVLLVANNRVLAEAVTSKEGKYELIDVQVPVATVKYPWGTSSHADFSVVATAKGFGLAWRDPIVVRTDWMRKDRADELSAELPGQAKQVVIEPDVGATLDLSFRPASSIRGRVVDEKGKPIAGVSVLPLNCIQYSTDKKAEPGKTDAFVLSGFSDRRVSQPLITDEHGSFAVANLPKDVGVWVSVKQPGFADADVGITNSDRLGQDYANSVIKVSESSEALITLRSTHPVVIKVTDSQTGLPIPGLGIQTNEWFEDPGESGKGARSYAQGPTDDQGRVKFQLPKGKHYLFVVTEVNAPYIFRNQIVDVTGEAAEQVFTMPIRRHSQVTVRIVDAQSKKGIPGVPIWISRSKTFDGNTDLYSIFSHRPVSDAAGEIKGFLSDGQVQIGLGALRTHRLILPEGYEADAADNRTGREFELKDGKDVTVEFVLRKKAAGEKDRSEKTKKDAAQPIMVEHSLTISGRALDPDKKPIPGATVYLQTTGNGDGTDRLLAEVKTDQDGRYEFRDAKIPVRMARLNSERSWAHFQVYGKAPGKAFAWQGVKRLIVDARCKNPDGTLLPEFRGNGLLPGEKLKLDLEFQRPRPVVGRVVDDQGKPIAGLEITMILCDYLDKEGKEPHFDFRGLGVYAGTEVYKIMPQELTAKTDAEGRFELNSNPPEIFGLLWFEHPDFSTKVFGTITSDRAMTDRDGIPLRKSPIELVLPRPRTIIVQVRHSDTDAPASGVGVTANAADGSNLSSHGESDKEGRAVLKLPPGKYRLDGHSKVATTHLPADDQTLIVAESPAEQSAIFQLDLACQVKFKVVDADSGRPIPGLSFWSTTDMEMALARSLERVLSQPHVAESPPVTNDKGEFTAVFKPGKLRFGFHRNELPAGYAAVSNDDQTFGREVVLPAGKVIEVEFKLRKVAGADPDKRKGD